MAERLRGRAAVEQRKRRLAAEPLCRICAANGVTRAATVPDHITPLYQGGTDDEDNIQCLCEPCHSLKSASEDTALFAANPNPDWLKPSAIPLTILSGPPCSGKTTYIERHAAAGDIIIDLDSIMTRLKPDYRHWSGDLDGALMSRAIRVRNATLGALCRQVAGRAWFIASSPSQAERDWWRSKLGGAVLLLHPGVEECKRRAIERGTPRAIAGVDRWEQAAAKHWEPYRAKLAKSAVGNDGWPSSTI